MNLLNIIYMEFQTASDQIFYLNYFGKKRFNAICQQMILSPYQ